MSFGSYDPTKQVTKGNRPQKFYLKDGSNLYRVLPPNKSLQDKNKIAQFQSIIWVTDSNGKKRPVASILKDKSNGKGMPKTILQADPLLNKMEEYKAQLESAITAKENPAVIASLRTQANRIRHFKQYALNVISTDGTLGVLEIPYTSFQALDQRIRDLYTKGIDAIGIGLDKGIYFDFRKQKDERGKTVYTVDAAMKSGRDSNGNMVMSFIVAPLTAEEGASLAARAEDLTKLYRELTPDEQDALATMDQRVFDAIFQRSQPVEEVEAIDEDDQQLGNYQQLTSNGANFGPPAAQTVNPAQSYNQSLTSTPAVNPQQVMSTGFQQGSVLNNEKVKNFLFPDKKG